MSTEAPESSSHPSSLAYILSFLLVGVAWGFTTPFIRKAAVTHTSPTAATHPSAFDLNRSFVARNARLLFWTVAGLLRNPRYLIPLVVNLTGSVWFFLLVGQAELSLTVPITNSLAFLFTVLGEYLADGKLIAKDTWLGMGFVCVGIGICVAAKT